jgi:hypothetical protein
MTNMQHLFKRFARGTGLLLLPLIILTAAVLFLPEQPGQAQTSTGGAGEVTWGSFDGMPNGIVGSTASNLTSTAILVRQNRGIAIFPSVTPCVAGSANVTFKFNVSYDGTNYTTHNPLTILVGTASTNSSGVVLAYTNFPIACLDNARYLKLTAVQNGFASDVTNVTCVYSYRN